MKIKPLIIALTSVGCLTAGAVWVSADWRNTVGIGQSRSTVPTTIPYQGMLERDGEPVNAETDFNLALYTVSQDGTAIWNETHQGIDVQQGRFAFEIGGNTPLDGAMLRSAAELYLAIEVKIAGLDDDFVPLAGRQKILSSPYAIVAAQLPNLYKDENGDLRIELDTDSEQKLVVNDNLQITADGDISTAGNLHFGNTKRQMVTLLEGYASYGIGVQNSTVYTRTHENFAWYKQGVHDDYAFDPGEGGTVLMSLDGEGNLDVSGDILGNLESIQFTAEVEAEQHNVAGSDIQDLGDEHNRVCFLTKVSLEDNDEIGEAAGCILTITEGKWQLIARLKTTTGTTDADVWCAARCLTW